MPKRLVDNVNSRYFEAANHMRPKWKKHKVIVYVESYDDIFFWRDILAEFETDDLGFEVSCMGPYADYNHIFQETE